MGLFDFMKSDKSEPLLSMDDAIRIGIPITSSGQRVTWKTAVHFSTVCACINVVANGIAQIPFKLMHSADGVRRNAEEKELYWLLKRGPNPYMSDFEFRHTLAMHLMLTGNAFVWLNRVRGNIVEMYPYQPQSVRRYKDPKGDGWRQYYEILLKNGRLVRVEDEDMWHIKWRAYDSVSGLDAVNLAREAVGIGLAGEEMAGNIYAQGTHIDGYLSTDRTLSKDARDSLRDEWVANFSGQGNAGRTPIMGGDLKFIPLSKSTAQEAQLIESRNFQIGEVCRMFGVQPMMVYQYEKASTYASSEQMMLSHVIHTLSPWYRLIETSANLNLLSEQDFRKGYYFKFIEAGLLRGDMASQAKWFQQLVQLGVMSPNEVRDMLDMNPYEGGDVHLVPLNMTTPDIITSGTEKE